MKCFGVMQIIYFIFPQRALPVWDGILALPVLKKKEKQTKKKQREFLNEVQKPPNFII